MRPEKKILAAIARKQVETSPFALLVDFTKVTVAQNEAIVTRADAILARAALEHAIGHLRGADSRPERTP